MLPILLTATLLGARASQAAPAPAKTQRYCNAKYDYCVSVPSSLKPQYAPPAQDGQVFLSDDMFVQIHVMANLNVFNQTIVESYQAELKRKKLTYHQLLKDSYVISGMDEGGSIFYQKTVLEAGRFRSLLFLYPPARKAEFDRLIPEVLKSFVGSQTPAWAGLWKFAEKDPKQSHYLLLKGSEANPAGVYTGSEEDEYLFFTKVGVSQLQISPDGGIRFKLGPRSLFQTPQDPKTPPVIKSPANAGMTGVEWIFEGKIKGNTLKLSCKVGDKGIPGVDRCWKPEMTFIKVK